MYLVSSSKPELKKKEEGMEVGEEGSKLRGWAADIEN